MEQNDVVSGEVNALMKEQREAAAQRQATEDSLHGSGAKLQAMFEFSSAGMIQTECETGRFLAANAAMCRLVDYNEAELSARTIFDITHPDERERDREAFERLLTGALPVLDVEKRCIRKDGKAIWLRMVADIIRDGSGRPVRCTAVIMDIDARKQAEQGLQTSKDRLQFALNAAQLGWWQFDPLSGMTSCDKRFREIFGLTEDEEHIDMLVDRVHPDDKEKVRAGIAASLNPASLKPAVMEHRLQPKDGKVRWVETHWLPYFQETGDEQRAVRVVGTSQDITERKEREEKEHLLMREINHRAKNMLSVVDAIAHQTAARNPEDFVERFSARIQALSANQDLLVRNDWQGVDVADLACAQLAHFADLIGSRIALDGPRLLLNPASAQAIGLALHELATNAGKYGALSTDKGRVDIGWSIGDDTFALRWTERDGPPVCPPKRCGFGTVVMEAMAERGVRGAVNLDYARSGITWYLTCPAANVLAPGTQFGEGGQVE